MYRKLGLILIVVSTISFLFLYLRNRNEVEPTRFIDRLPDADIIGRADVLEMATEFMPTLYYYKIPVREFVSPDFFLSQGKAYGIDFQTPLYFFGTESDEKIKDWGALIPVDDSSKVLDGILAIGSVFDVRDTIIFDKKIYISNSLNLAVSYGKDWLLVSSTKKFPRYLRHVIQAKRNSISPRWKKFLNDETFADKPLVVRAISPRLKENGIESLLIAPTGDSTSITLNTRVTQFDSLSFQLKEDGPYFDAEEYSNRTINAHFNIDRLRGNTSAPLYRLLEKVGKKVSFPLDEFLDAWDGDVAFRMGGIQKIKEEYIESELDENFNVTEVVKYKEVKISGFSLYLSMNKRKENFLTSIFQKGILTTEGKKMRLLYFPPMYMKDSDTSLLFHTGRYAPVVRTDSSHYGLWTFDYTPVSFSLDSAETKSIYGKVQIPLKKLIRDYLPETLEQE